MLFLNSEKTERDNFNEISQNMEELKEDNLVLGGIIETLLSETAALHVRTDDISKAQSELARELDKDKELNRVYLYELKSRMVTSYELESLLAEYSRSGGSIEPTMPVNYMERGEIVFDGNWDPDAMKRYALGELERDPYGLDALKLMGQLEYEDGNWHAAKSYYEKIIEIEPDYLTSYRILARIAYMDGEYDRSNGYLQHEWELVPTAQTAVSMARNYLNLSWIDEAREQITKALMLEAEYLPALHTGGEISLALNDTAGAYGFYERVYDQKGDRETAQFLGDLSYKLNEKNRALEYWDEALELNPLRTREDQTLQLTLLERMMKCACSLDDGKRVTDYVYFADELGGSEEVSIMELRYLQEKNEYRKTQLKAGQFEEKYPFSTYSDEVRILKKWAKGI